MLQYIFNVSIIWLAFLLFYELLFRNESFHQYNRIYLIIGLAAGLLLPDMNMSRLIYAHQNTPVLPRIIHFYEAKANIAASSNTTIVQATQANLIFALWLVYLAGASIGLALVVRELIQLRHFYITGKKLTEENCIIIETGRSHPPFSFFNIIFVSSKEDYHPAHWRMLVEHEKAHWHQLHTIDNLLLTLLRLLFWFHPLPHIYHRKLKMLHEFQADHAIAANHFDYGTFLLEQSIMQRKSFLTNALSYSPIKKRIMMLIRIKSTRRSLLKYLAVFPLMLVLMMLCTRTSFSEDRHVSRNKVFFKGNEIELAELKVIPFEYRETLEQQRALFFAATLPDSVPVKDWRTGSIVMRPVLSNLMPVTINGKPIFGNEQEYFLSPAYTNETTPVVDRTDRSFDEFIFGKLKEEISKLNNGDYVLHINRIVIDEQGKIAYYENEGISFITSSSGNLSIIDENVKKDIHDKITAILENDIKFKPALKDGKPVNARLSFGNYDIIVRDHKASIQERTGC